MTLNLIENLRYSLKKLSDTIYKYCKFYHCIILFLWWFTKYYLNILSLILLIWYSLKNKILKKNAELVFKKLCQTKMSLSPSRISLPQSSLQVPCILLFTLIDTLRSSNCLLFILFFRSGCISFISSSPTKPRGVLSATMGDEATTNGYSNKTSNVSLSLSLSSLELALMGFCPHPVGLNSYN